MTITVELNGQTVEAPALDHARVKTLARVLYGMTPMDETAQRRHARWALKRALQLIQQMHDEVALL